MQAFFTGFSQVFDRISKSLSVFVDKALKTLYNTAVCFFYEPRF